MLELGSRYDERRDNVFWGAFADAVNVKMIMRTDLDNTRIWSTFIIMHPDFREEEGEMAMTNQRGVVGVTGAAST